MSITKTKLAIAVVAIALLVPTMAYAVNPFVDVPSGSFYADAVDWAYNNGITTGTSATTFSPEANVTRGENVTFAHRYDTNIVQPALADLETQVAVAAFAQGDSSVVVPPNAIVQSVSLTPPADGTVIVNSFAGLANLAVGRTSIGCSITQGTTIDFDQLQRTDTLDAPLSGTRGFDVTAGVPFSVNLVCGIFEGSAAVQDATLTAIFAPS